MEEQLYYNIVRANNESEYTYNIYVSSDEALLVDNCNWQLACSVLGTEDMECIWGKDAIGSHITKELEAMGMVRSRKLCFEGERSL